MSNAMVPIGKITLTSAQTNVTLANLPQNYRDLRLVVNGWGSAEINIVVQFNADGGSNYSMINFRGFSTSSYASSSSTSTGIVSNYSTGMTAGNYGVNLYDIFDYTQSDKHKSVLLRANHGAELDVIAARWASTAAITSITINSAFSAGSSFELFGIIA